MTKKSNTRTVSMREFCIACLVKIHADLSRYKGYKNIDEGVQMDLYKYGLLRFWEIIKHDSYLMQIYSDFGLDMDKIKDARNHIGHCAKFDDSVVKKFLSVFLDDRSTAYLLNSYAEYTLCQYTDFSIPGSNDFMVSSLE